MHKGKKFSIFGDSLSTLQGYQPEGYKVHYQGAFSKESGVETMEDTWWGKVIRHFDGELLTCNAFSGCMVSDYRDDGIRFPSAASDERMDNLCSAGIPDILMIYLGTNDWNNLIETEDFEEPWWKTFGGAYDHMLSGLRQRLPETDIWCMNLTYSQNMKFHFYPAEFRRMQDFNQVISKIAKRYGAKVVDLWTNAAEYTSSDLAHADREGMTTIASAIINAITASGSER